MAFRATQKAAFLKPLARWYQGQVFGKLSKLGVRYEDLLIESADVDKAHAWQDAETMAMRDRRIKRAIDLSMKHTYLPEEVAAVQDPGNFYLSDAVNEAKKLREERELLNA